MKYCSRFHYFLHRILLKLLSGSFYISSTAARMNCMVFIYSDSELYLTTADMTLYFEHVYMTIIVTNR